MSLERCSPKNQQLHSHPITPIILDQNAVSHPITPLVRILERGITLFHSYSRNKSDYKNKLLYSMLFSKWNSKGKHGEIAVTSDLSTSPNLFFSF